MTTTSQRGSQVAAKAKSLLRTSTSILKVNVFFKKFNAVSNFVISYSYILLYPYGYHFLLVF